MKNDVTVSESLPERVDLRLEDWPVWSQGDTYQCSAYVVAGGIEILLYRRDAERFTPSHEFIFKNGHIEHKENFPKDPEPAWAGVFLKDELDGVKQYGVVSHRAWNGTGSLDSARRIAKPLRGFGFQSLIRNWTDASDATHPTVDAVKAQLAAGHPVGMGLYLNTDYHSRQARETGRIPEPSETTHHKGGTHALLLVGYDDEGFLIRNSVGPRHWGRENQGNGVMPYSYVTNEFFSFSLWTMTLQGETMSNSGLPPTPGNPTGFDSASFDNQSGTEDVAPFIAFPDPNPIDEDIWAKPIMLAIMANNSEPTTAVRIPSGSATIEAPKGNQIYPFAGYTCSQPQEPLLAREFMLWVWDQDQENHSWYWFAYHWKAEADSYPDARIATITIQHVHQHMVHFEVVGNNGEVLQGPNNVEPRTVSPQWLEPPSYGASLGGTLN